MQKVSHTFPWSLTAALTPGNHHVRLYLETEGRITTMLSRKDNFVEFLEPGTLCRDVSSGAPPEDAPLVQCGPDIGSVQFFDLTTSRPLDVRPRDPNISQNEAGVYVMTWDNRPATADYGPGGSSDSDAVSDFGLAFSVDGLNWTVWGNHLKIEGLPKVLSETQYCTVTATSGIRHVVPVFLTNDQIRLYFSNKILYAGSQPKGPPCWTNNPSCSLGTAISN